MPNRTELLKRSLTGVIYVAVVVATTLTSEHIARMFLAMISIWGLVEFYKNIQTTKQGNPNVISGSMLGITTYFLLAQPPAIWNTILLVAVLCFSILTFVMELYRKKESPFQNLALTFLGVCYISIPLALLFKSSFLNESYTAVLLLSVFIFIWSNDTFAYLTGSWFGKHKLFARISPAKSWEGFCGGFLLTLCIGGIYAWCSVSGYGGCSVLQAHQWIILSAIVALAGSFGDLIESLYKRSLGIKDSGNFLPGHGGVLDRFDSVLLAAPAVYAYLLLINL